MSTFNCKHCSDKFGIGIDLFVPDNDTVEKCAVIDRFLKKHDLCGQTKEFIAWRKNIGSPGLKKAARMVSSLIAKGVPPKDALDMGRELLESI